MPANSRWDLIRRLRVNHSPSFRKTDWKILCFFVFQALWPLYGLCGQTSDVDTDSVDTDNVDTGSVDTGSVDTGSVDTDSVDTGSVVTDNVDTDSVDTDNL